MMRKFAVLAVAALAVLGITAAVALAADSSVTYTSKLGQTKAVKKSNSPLNVTYTGTLDVAGVPAGNQPDVAPKTDAFFDKNLVNNSSKFPATCTQEDIDGKGAIPSKCAKSLVGTGNATAVGGQPGQPQSPALTESLSVKAYNGKPSSKNPGKVGKYIFLVVNGTAPIQVPNRVIVGTISKTSGKYNQKVQFFVPPELQQQLGSLPVALTHFSVTIPASKTAKVKRRVKGKTKTFRVSYLQIKACPKNKNLNTKATSHFATSLPSPPNPTAYDRSSEGTYKCK